MGREGADFRYVKAADLRYVKAADLGYVVKIVRQEYVTRSSTRGARGRA